MRVAMLALGPSPGWAQGSATAKAMPSDTLKEKLDKGDKGDKGEKVLVIDVRSDEEVKAGSIPGAIHIPVEQLEGRMKDVPPAGAIKLN